MNEDCKSVVSAPRYPDNHDPFWPRLTLPALRTRLKLGDEVSEARLELAVRCAAINAANEFASWRIALRQRGHKRLEEVAGHASGRALMACYVRFLEAEVLQTLLASDRGGAYG